MQRPADSAFTLLEVLVALALIGILAGVLYGALHAGFRAARRTEEALGPARAAFAALEIIRRDLVSAVPPGGVLAGPFVGADETGDSTGEPADEVSFYAVAEGVDGENVGIRMIEYAPTFENGASTGMLVRRVSTNLLAPVAQEPPEEIVCRGVLSFDLSYFDGTSWQESWDSSARDDALPAAVAVTLCVRDPDKPVGAGEHCELTRKFVVPCGWASGGQVAGSTPGLR